MRALLLPGLLFATALGIAVACSSQPTPSACGDGCPPNAVCRSGQCVPVETDSDAGVSTDAGIDAGNGDPVGDAGIDAGDDDAGISDAGFIDGGEDGGEDAGFDAGVMDAGYCVEDPGNLLANPGFECGDPPGAWIDIPAADLSADTSSPHTGMQTAKLTARSTSSINLYPSTPPVEFPGVQHFCASVWVQSETTGTVRLTIQRQNSGGIQESTFAAPLTTSWQRLDIDSVSSALDEKVTVRVQVQNPTAGLTLYVDDVQLWVSSTGRCNER